MSYSASELILNPDGSVYHLGLRGEDVPNLVFTVGDPDRVSSITAHFDEIHWTKIRREFNIIRGTLKGQEVMVLSTGMGTDNIDIVMNELDAAGLNVQVLVGIYGAERDEYIARSKVILSVSFYASNILESTRVVHALANGKAVVAECSDQTEYDLSLIHI